MKSFVVLLALLNGASALIDYGVVNYTCDATLFKPSKKIPTNVNSLRPADIKVVMALGDSLTAANGAGAEDPIGVALQYRGLAFQAGGDGTLETHATIPNILKKYNPNLKGYSTGIGSPSVWEIAKFNLGYPGAKARDLLEQAHYLVQLLQYHTEYVNINEDWKLLNIFIGGNDCCDWCGSQKDQDYYAPQACANHVQDAIQFIYDNVPRVIVSVTGMLHVDMLRKTDKNHPMCQRYHVSECPCESNTNFTDLQLSNYCTAYNDDEMAIQTSGKFEKSDFTVVVQPFFRDATDPPMGPDGKPNMGFFAPDCFHFSQYGHGLVSTWLWKNILEPVGSKTTKGSLTYGALPLQCPDPACPFVRTTLNSQNCTTYMTPSA